MESYLFEIDNVRNDMGFLGFLENGKIPFNLERVYYITETSDRSRRGNHGHIKLKQILIAPIGRFEVKVINKWIEGCRQYNQYRNMTNYNFLQLPRR